MNGCPSDIRAAVTQMDYPKQGVLIHLCLERILLTVKNNKKLVFMSLLFYCEDLLLLVYEVILPCVYWKTIVLESS